ncbi:MAG TPA: hypothetical protein VI916_14840 [Acidimicrobiia bacterium]|nr:hypothetical protein [Acidimicrobiia bacterium]
MLDAEQGETFPTASAAVARKVVVEFVGTLTPIEKVPSDAVPVAATPPEQSAFVYRRTVEPASAVPSMLGVVHVADGEPGVVPVKTGGSGTVAVATSTGLRVSSGVARAATVCTSWVPGERLTVSE